MIEPVSFSWTEENLAKLAELIASADKLTAKQIAAQLGTTKNSIVAKAHRLGWKLPNYNNHNPFNGQNRADPIAKNKQFDNFGFRRFHPVAQMSVPLTLRADPVESLQVDLLDLKHDQCRWPFGEGPFTFCGHPKAQGVPYCSKHKRLAYGQRPV